MQLKLPLIANKSGNLVRDSWTMGGIFKADAAVMR